jgi:ABC-type Na+ efflux pump permease subunit
MTDILLKLLVIIIFIFVLYLSFRTSKVKEGFSIFGGGSPSSSSSSSSSSSNSAPVGLAGNATNYASAINTQVTKLTDALLISKYKSDYATAVEALINYVRALSLDLVLNISPTDISNNNITSTLETLNTYNIALVGLYEMSSQLSSTSTTSTTS